MVGGALIANDCDVIMLIFITRGRLLLNSLGSFTYENNKVRIEMLLLLSSYLNIMI